MDMANGCKKVFSGGGDRGYLSLKKAPTGPHPRIDSNRSYLDTAVSSDSEAPTPLISPAAPSAASQESPRGRHSVAGAPALRQRSSSIASQVVTEEPRVSLCSAWSAGKMVINPQANQFLPFWDGMMVTLIILVSLLVPYQVAFRFGSFELGHFVWLYHANELLFVADMALQFFISSPDPVNHRWIRMPPFIVSFYIRTSLCTDIMSVLPYGGMVKSISRYTGKDLRAFCVVKLLHMLKMQRVSRLQARYSTRVGVPYAMSKLTKLFVLLVLALHWLACCWGMILSIQRFAGINIGDTWADVLRDAKPGMFKEQVDRPWELYTASLYWSCMTITSIGYGDISASNMLEAWCCIVLMAACGLMWANIIGSICALASALDAENVMHENRMDSMNTMLQSFDLPKEDRMRLREYTMRSKVLYHRSHQVELMRCMSPELQGMVARFVQQSIMQKVWFLADKEVSDGFVVGLFERFQFALYPPRELVRLRRSMVCLRTGVALLKARILSAGSIWGIEDTVISNKDLLQNYTPLSLSYLELQYVTRSSLKELIAGFPAEEKMIRKGAVWLALRTSLLRHVVKPSWVNLDDHKPKPFGRSRTHMQLEEEEEKEPESPGLHRQVTGASLKSVTFTPAPRVSLRSYASSSDSIPTTLPTFSAQASMMDGQQVLIERSERKTLESKLKEALDLLEGSLVVQAGDPDRAVENKISMLSDLLQQQGSGNDNIERCLSKQSVTSRPSVSFGDQVKERGNGSTADSTTEPHRSGKSRL